MKSVPDHSSLKKLTLHYIALVFKYILMYTYKYTRTFVLFIFVLVTKNTQIIVWCHIKKNNNNILFHTENTW